MLHIGAGHSNNCQRPPICNRGTLQIGDVTNRGSYKNDNFNIMYLIGKITNNISNDILPQKTISKMHLEVSEVLITYVTNRGKARVMLHIGAGHGNNCQIILQLFGYDIFCNNLQHKNNFRQI